LIPGRDAEKQIVKFGKKACKEVED
jgi:hypothetical protein